jgi:hypothetical protein
MDKIIIDNFVDAIINTKGIPIIYEGIKYYPIEQNYNIDDVECLTIDYKNRKIIYGVNCIVFNNDYIICCYFTDNKIVNNIDVEGIYIIVNKLTKLILKYITCDATFKNKNCCEYFDDFEEISKDDFIMLDDDT